MIFYNVNVNERGKRKGIEIFQKRSILNQNPRLTNKKRGTLLFNSKIPPLL